MSSTSAEAGLYEFEGWQLTPEGAAIHPGERTAVIADLHLGYEWARGAAGDCVVAHSLDETLARLSLVLGRASDGSSDRGGRPGRVDPALPSHLR